MSYRDKIAGLVQKAFQKLGDLPTEIAYVRVTPGTYDPDSDTQADVSAVYVLSAPLVGLTEAEQDWWKTNLITQKVLIAGRDLPLIPEENDRIVIGGTVVGGVVTGGVTWSVKKVKRVPGDSVYVVYIQEP
jgi:hypothetical protein